MHMAAGHEQTAGMNGSTLAAVFARLRVALHLLVACLVSFVIVREWTIPDSRAATTIVIAVAFLGTYAAGAMWPRRLANAQTGVVGAWLALLTVEALALGALSPDAAYLVFPLFVLYLHLLPGWWGVAAVAGCAWLAILVTAFAGRLSTGGVVGPLVAAAAAIAVGLGYRALYRETLERQRLIDALLAAREELAEKEREAGVLSERARLAREIHDTVAQGLASIQLLLHAAERADDERPGIEHIRLARETAALNLEETRRFIRALTPKALDNQTLVGALQRLAESARQAAAARDSAGSGSGDGLQVDVRVSGDAAHLPTAIETALLRVAQGALANVLHHARAQRVMLTLTYMEDAVTLDIVDNGRGFDPTAMPARRGGDGGQSFGVTAMRTRVDQLGGEFTLESAPGSGTAVAVKFGLSV
jgi:signal transduction histidine kinase